MPCCPELYTLGVLCLYSVLEVTSVLAQLNDLDNLIVVELQIKTVT